MKVTYPLIYPVIEAQKNYLNHNLLSYIDYNMIDLPLSFYLELATKLDKKESSCAKTPTSCPIGALFIPLFSVKIPYSFFVLIIINSLYAFFVKNPIIRRDFFKEEPSIMSENSYLHNNKHFEATDIFPTGLDIYLTVSSVFGKENSRGSTWFYYLLLTVKTVPSWVVPVLTLLLIINKKRSTKD